VVNRWYTAILLRQKHQFNSKFILTKITSICISRYNYSSYDSFVLIARLLPGDSTSKGAVQNCSEPKSKHTLKLVHQGITSETIFTVCRIVSYLLLLFALRTTLKEIMEIPQRHEMPIVFDLGFRDGK